MEESHTHRPALHPAAIEAVLTAMRAGHPVGDHPLRHFLTVQNRVLVPHALAGETAVDVAIFDYVTGLILEHLSASRLDHQLAPPDHSFSDALLEIDFQQNNQELEIWSVLFHRYLCVQHDLLMQDIAERVHQTVRTVRRRLNLGLTRLTHIIIRAEQRARRDYAEQRLRLALPSIHPPWLINSDVVMPPILHFLEQGQAPQHVVLHGPAGCGKTTVARAVAHELVSRHTLDDLVWLDCAGCVPNAADLVLKVAHRVGIPLHDPGNVVGSLRAYLFKYNVLIVLDSADALLRDAQKTEEVLAALESARVLLTSRSGMPKHLWYYDVNIPLLNRQQAAAYLEHLAQRSSPANRHWPERFEAIWAAVGGNPLAIKTVWAASRTIPLEVVLADSHIQHIYRQVWEQLTEDDRHVWMLSLLFLRNTIPHTALIALSGLPDQRANQGLSHLVDAALLEVQDGEEWCYSLEPVCVTFLTNLARQCALIDANDPVTRRLRAGVLNRISQLLATPDADGAVHVLHVIADLEFDTALYWDAAQKLAPQIIDAGAWAAWSDTLKRLSNRTLSPTQVAWIDRMRGVAQRWLGQLDMARHYLERALATYQEHTDNYSACLVELSVVQRYQGQWDVAHQQLQDALAFYENHDDSQGLARCTNDLGQLALDAGHPEQALPWLDCLTEWTARDWGLASQAYLALEQYDRALQAAERALRMIPQQHPNYARTLVTIGQIFDFRGESAAAVRYLLAAVNALDHCKDTLGYARASNNLAVAYIHLGAEEQRYDETSINQEICRLLVHAQDIQVHIGDELGLAVTQRNLAWLNDLGICNLSDQNSR